MQHGRYCLSLLNRFLRAETVEKYHVAMDLSRALSIPGPTVMA